MIGKFKFTSTGINKINENENEEDEDENEGKDEWEKDEKPQKKRVTIKIDATKGLKDDIEDERIQINKLGRNSDDKIKKAFNVIDDDDTNNNNNNNNKSRPVYEVGNLYKKFKNDPLEAIINSVDPADEPNDIREFNQRTHVVDRIIDRANNLNRIKDLEFQNAYIDFLMIVHSNLNPSSNVSALKTTMLGQGIISSSFNPRIIEIPANKQQQHQFITATKKTKSNNNNNNNDDDDDDDDENDEDDDDEDDDDIFEKNSGRGGGIGGSGNLEQLAGKFRLQPANEQDIKDYRLTKEIQNIVDTSAVQGRVEMTPAILSAVSYALTALSTRDRLLFPPDVIKLDNFIPVQQVRHRFANLVSICGIINNIRAPSQYYHNRAIDDRNQEAYDLITSMIDVFKWNREKKRYEISSSSSSNTDNDQYRHRPRFYSNISYSSYSSNRLRSFVSGSKRY